MRGRRLVEEVLDLVTHVAIGVGAVHERARTTRELSPERHRSPLRVEEPGDGRGATIGPNAVVTTDVPSHDTVVVEKRRKDRRSVVNV